VQHSRQRRRLVQAEPLPTVQANAVTPSATQTLMARKRKLRRSEDLMRAVAQVDVTTDPATQRELLEWINAVYEDRGGGPLIGLFSHCYLGHPFIDHKLDFGGRIIQHYTPHDQVPPGFEAARPLARSTAYAFIEVYADGMVVPIRPDGLSAV